MMQIATSGDVPGGREAFSERLETNTSDTWSTWKAGGTGRRQHAAICDGPWRGLLTPGWAQRVRCRSQVAILNKIQRRKGAVWGMALSRRKCASGIWLTS